MSNLCDIAHAARPGPVTVLEDRYFPGIDDPADGAERVGQAVSIQEAFSTAWESDAHFALYWLHDPRLAEPVAVRWNRPSLPKIRKLGGELLIQMVGVDLDNPGHAPWTDDLWADFLGILQAHQAAGWSRPLEANCFYTTKNGCRFVYLLDQPLPADEFGKYAMGLVREFQQHGLVADELKDWTRLFRLPRVERDGERTEKAPFFQCFENWEQATKKDSIPVWLEGLDFDYSVEESERPSAEEVTRMLKVETDGQLRDSQWFKDAKKVLRRAASRPYSIIAEGQEIAPVGQRDISLQQVLGQTVGVLYQSEVTSTPEQAYALFHEPLMGLTPDSGTPCWHERGWKLIQEFWAREAAKKKDEIVLTLEQEEERKDLLTRMADGMAEWCDAPDLQGDPETRARFVLSRLFLGDRTSVSGFCNRYYILLPTGYYSGLPVIGQGLYDALAKMKGDAAQLQHLIGGLEKEIGNGKTVHKTVADITQGHTLFPSRFRSVYNGRSRVTYEVSFEDDHEVVTVNLPMFWLNEGLKPRFDEGVHGLLMAMAGGDEIRANELCAAIAWSLDFSRPTAGLFLWGPAACGKTLIARGLAECMANPMTAGKQAFQRFNGTSLKTSPFIWIDEGWPDHRSVQHNIAHTFRQLVGGGGGIELEEKGKDSQGIDFNWRILVTANNDSVLKDLENSVQTPNDRQAIAERSFPFEISQDATDFLAERGGFEFTAGWIAASAMPSKYIVAQHFLWLFENRYALKPPGPKYGYTGDVSDERLKSMVRSSPAESLVSEILIDLLNIATPTPQIPHAVITVEDIVAVRLGDIEKYYRATYHGKVSTRLDSNKIRTALNSLAPDGSPTGSARRNLTPWTGGSAVIRDAKASTRTWAVCPIRLHEFADAMGLSCPSLDRFMDSIEDPLRELPR